MAGAQFGIEVRGLAPLLKKLKNEKATVGRPVRDFFDRSTSTVQKHARNKAPVDRGHLRQAIDTEIDSDPIPAWAKVGVISAPWGTEMGYKAFSMEYGTGIFGEGPKAKKQRYFPPPKVLETWAKRHGFASGYQVALIIYRRGGIKPRRFLRDGLEDSMGSIKRFARQLPEDIKKALER